MPLSPTLSQAIQKWPDLNRAYRQHCDLDGQSNDLNPNEDMVDVFHHGASADREQPSRSKTLWARRVQSELKQSSGALLLRVKTSGLQDESLDIHSVSTNPEGTLSYTGIRMQRGYYGKAGHFEVHHGDNIIRAGLNESELEGLWRMHGGGSIA